MKANLIILSILLIFKPFCAECQSVVFNLGDHCSQDVKDASKTINQLLKKGDVFIPSGEWRLETTIYLPSGTKIHGAGRDSSVLWSDFPLRMIEIEGNNNEISGLFLRGPNITENASYLIFKRRGTKQMYVRNCNFEGATGGIFVDAACDSVFVEGCHFSEMYPCKEQSSSGYGIVLNHNDNKKERGTFHGVIERNVFHDTVFRHALYLQSCEDIIVRHNYFYGLNEKKPTGYEYFVNIRGCKNMLFEKNVCRQGYGFINGVSSRYHDRGTDFVIQDNIFIDNVSSNNNLGVLNVRFNNTLVRNNIFIDYKTTAIYIANVDGAVIENNSFVVQSDSLYPVMEVKEKKIKTLTIKKNSVSGISTEPAIIIENSTIESLNIVGNTFDSSVGLRIQGNKMTELFITDNVDESILVDYQKNRVLKTAIYSRNTSKSHPQIVVTK